MIEFDKYEFIIVANSCVIIIQVNYGTYYIHKMHQQSVYNRRVWPSEINLCVAKINLSKVSNRKFVSVHGKMTASLFLIYFGTLN